MSATETKCTPGAAEAALLAHIETLFPGARVVAQKRLGPDAGEGGAETEKGIGYGEPVRVELELASGEQKALVLHFFKADRFGHDRRSDRLGAAMLGYDTFGLIPRHVRALDVGVARPSGELLSLGDTTEPYLLTEWANGEPYAEDLRRLAESGVVEDRDRARVDVLASALADIHSERGGDPALYHRAWRDLVGHGEGVFGIVDGYPSDTPAAPASRLEAIEQECLRERARHKQRTSRLCRVHGDFHPFNILFDGHADLHLLDTSRGSVGEAADDVACLAINFVFFALTKREHWHSGLGALFHRFLERYLELSGDDAMVELLAPFFAWRGLVLANPLWYPALTAADRDRLLGFVERTLTAPRFDPRMADELFE